MLTACGNFSFSGRGCMPSAHSLAPRTELLCKGAAPGTLGSSTWRRTWNNSKRPAPWAAQRCHNRRAGSSQDTTPGERARWPFLLPTEQRSGEGRTGSYTISTGELLPYGYCSLLTAAMLQLSGGAWLTLFVGGCLLSVLMSTDSWHSTAALVALLSSLHVVVVR